MEEEEDGPANTIQHLRMEVMRLRGENATLKAIAVEAIELAKKGAERVRAQSLAYALATYKAPRNKGGRPSGRLSFSKWKITHANWWELFQIAWTRMEIPMHARKTQRMAIDHLVRLMEQHEIEEMGGKRWSSRERDNQKKRIADSIADYKKSQKPSA